MRYDLESDGSLRIYPESQAEGIALAKMWAALTMGQDRAAAAKARGILSELRAAAA